MTASSFRFNFASAEESTPNTASSATVKLDSTVISPTRISVETVMQCASASEHAHFEPSPITGVVKRRLDDAIAAITADSDPDGSLLEALRLDSDVLDRRYEGGLKTWECAVDLALFLREEAQRPGRLRVLELGCGSGLPSIVAAMDAAGGMERLTLQDYNLAVLKHLTLPNCNANGISPARIDCIYGDWLGIETLLPVHGYDLILASETIYRPESYAVMTAIIKHALAPQGTALVAAKDYYFGLGGSVDQFIRHIATAPTGLAVTLARHFDEGVARSILRIVHKEPA